MKIKTLADPVDAAEDPTPMEDVCPIKPLDCFVAIQSTSYRSILVAEFTATGRLRFRVIRDLRYQPPGARWDRQIRTADVERTIPISIDWRWWRDTLPRYAGALVNPPNRWYTRWWDNRISHVAQPEPTHHTIVTAWLDSRYFLN